MDNNKQSTTKLNDFNGYKWTYEIKMILQSKDLWKNCEYEDLTQYMIEMIGAEEIKERKKEAEGIFDKEKKRKIIMKIEDELTITSKEKMKMEER